MWKNNEIVNLDANTLMSLVNNQVAGVKIADFASSEEIEGFTRALTGQSCRTQSVKQVTRLGISQYEQGVCNSKQAYFDRAKEVSESFNEIFEQSFSPRARFIECLRKIGIDAAVMHEPGYGDYFAGNGKLRNGLSPIHVDFAPQDSADWLIGSSKAQLAWNFYLQVPNEGGELLLWDKFWQPADDVYQVEGSYFYDEKVVEGCPLLKVKVSPGEVVIINARNFHAVAESKDRLAFGSFISVFDDDTYRLWS